MQHLRAPWRRLPIGLLCVAALVLMVACGSPGENPQTTLSPGGPYAARIDHLFRITVWLAVIVFVGVEGALLYAIFKFRGKPDDAEPAQTHGNTMVELIWTIIPAVVPAVVAVPTVQTILTTAEVPTSSPDGQPPLLVEVIGHQWWWEFRYPSLNITTAGELHVPLGRTVDLRMKSADVIHAFWVPRFTGKRDVFPNRETRLWFTPDSVGAFPGACTEYCGTQHGRMDYYLVVEEPAAFNAYIALRTADSVAAPTLRKPTDTVKVMAGVDPMVSEGEQLFITKGCIGCHSLASNHGATMVGPNLSGIGTRKMIAAGWLEDTDDNLMHWIENPQQFKHGILMRPKGNEDPQISDAEAKALVAYLRTKK